MTDKNQGKVDPDSLKRATAKARQTGTPQPVKDGAGKVIYYVDTTGSVLPKATGEDAVRRSKSAAQTRADNVTSGAVNAKGGLNNPKQAAAQRQQIATQAPSSQNDPTGANYDAAQQAFAHGGNQTLNGVDMSATTDPLGIGGTAGKGAFGSQFKQNSDGSQQVLAGDGKTDLTNSTFGHQQLASQTGQATFAALGLGSGSGYSGTTPLMFSQGPGGLTPQGTQVDRAPKGNWVIGKKQDNRQDLIPGARGQYQNQPMNSAQQQNSAQYMTVQDGLSLFARMSVTDKDAYNSLVAQLNHAGYFAAQTGNMNYLPDSQLPLNTYSKNAGMAMVEAMQDLAVAQQNGETSDMASWLQKRSQGYEDYVKAGAGYNPVNRAYQDPATLAASAKAAAQQAIGRNLTPAEEAKFNAQFHGKESAAYNEMDSYGRAKAVANFQGTSGLPAGSPDGYTMPDTAGEADQFVNQGPQFAQEKAGYQSLELSKGLISFLKGGGL